MSEPTALTERSIFRRLSLSPTRRKLKRTFQRRGRRPRSHSTKQRKFKSYYSQSALKPSEKTPLAPSTATPKPTTAEERLGICPTRYSVPREYTGTEVVTPEETPSFDSLEDDSVDSAYLEQPSHDSCYLDTTTLFETAAPTKLLFESPPRTIHASPIMFARNRKKASPEASKKSAIKVYLLLIQPSSKLFELIELIYPRKNTTVSDLLAMIPKNVTEKVLAKQHYIGITRPKKRTEPITDLTMLASNNLHTAEPTANIVHGEIIAAIPAQCSSKQIVSLSKQILSNAHIQKLMVRSGSPPPLPRREGPCAEEFSESTHTTLSMISMTPIVEDSPYYTKTRVSQDIMDRDIKLERNHCITPPTKKQTAEDVLDEYLSKEDVDRMCRSVVDLSDDDASLASSYHSWAQSLESSATSKDTAVQEPLSPRSRKKQLQKHTNMVRRTLVSLFVLSVLRFQTDPGRISLEHPELLLQQPLSIWGLMSVVLSFFALVKLQRLFQDPSCWSNCPVLSIAFSKTNDEDTD